MSAAVPRQGKDIATTLPGGWPFGPLRLRSNCALGLILWSWDAADARTLLQYQLETQEAPSIKLNRRVTVRTTAMRLGHLVAKLHLRRPDAVRLLVAGADRGSSHPVGYDVTLLGRRPVVTEVLPTPGATCLGVSAELEDALVAAIGPMPTASHLHEEAASIAKLTGRVAASAARSSAIKFDGGTQSITISAGREPRLEARTADGSRGMAHSGVGGEIERVIQYQDGVIEAVKVAAIPLIDAEADALRLRIVRYEWADPNEFEGDLFLRTWIAARDPDAEPDREPLLSWPNTTSGVYFETDVERLAEEVARGWCIVAGFRQ